jgi:hypothetical protein
MLLPIRFGTKADLRTWVPQGGLLESASKNYIGGVCSFQHNRAGQLSYQELTAQAARQSLRRATAHKGFDRVCVRPSPSPEAGKAYFNKLLKPVTAAILSPFEPV